MLFFVKTYMKYFIFKNLDKYFFYFYPAKMNRSSYCQIHSKLHLFKVVGVPAGNYLAAPCSNFLSDLSCFNSVEVNTERNNHEQKKN